MSDAADPHTIAFNDGEQMRTSIVFPESLHEVIEDQVQAGVNGSVSEWFREAAYHRLLLQDMALEARGGNVRRGGVDE